MREKVGKSRNTVFFQWFVAPEGRKVGSLKRRVRSHLARWEMKNCTPLWREAHLQVKMYKTHHARTTFGSWDVEKAHAVVARSTFWSQNVQNTPALDHVWKLRCRKSAPRCSTKHILKSNCRKHTSSGQLLEVEMSKKCTPLWREAHFEVKSAKNWRVRTTFGRSDVLSRGRRKGLCTLSKVSKTWGFCSISKSDGRRGTFEEDHFFVAGAVHSTGGLEESQDALVRSCWLCTQLSIFEGSLAELRCFWCCQVEKLKKSRRSASFVMLSTLKNEEVSLNSKVFKLADRQTDRPTDRQTDRPRDR